MSTWMRRVAEYNRRLGEHPSRSRRVVIEPWPVTATLVYDHVHIGPVREGWWGRLRRRWRDMWNPWPSIWEEVHEASRRSARRPR